MRAVAEPQDALRRARRAGTLVEQARQDMLAHARDRRHAIADAHRHLSVRRIAAELGCSPSVVQAALRAADTNPEARHTTGP